MELDRNSTIPLHRQVENYIKKKISSGEWAVGTKLPSQRSLADSLAVNRSTVITALEELAALGLIEGRHGGGTKVINNTWGLVARRKPADWGNYVEAGRYKSNLPMIRKINEAEFYPGMIRMGTGELSPALLPNERFAGLLKNAPSGLLSLGYQEPKGDIRLREEISRHLMAIGIQTELSSILVVSGALQALQLISIGLLDHGSTLILEKPSYLYSIHVFQSLGMRFVGLPIDSDGMRPEKLSDYKKQYQGSIVYTIPSFHNPTGVVMTEKRRRELLLECGRERLPIIEDDVYRDLWLDAPPPCTLKGMDQSGNVLYIGSLSKILSPGLRIGWVVGPAPVIDRLADIKMQSDYGASSLSQWAAEESLRTGLYEEHACFVREQLKARRDDLAELLDQYFSDIAAWRIPTGGFYVWLKLVPKIDPHLLFEEALRHGILLNPGVMYDRGARQYLRLSYAYAASEEMKKAIRILRKLVMELAGGEKIT
ncbi:aminotransferase-like domain-containing protein [Sporolactobacillus putidus]|uniref:HTH-type transcriptional regulator YisV n=1 Tax=Sporolactobacillus putidus TaxID=492735 RepID=A0A917W2Q1_9BACL|nr:PLP-dependent aminotransferase family protein [Sporolactobacillus putidus]GGL54993.1 putative HTH-type transcriptional regulator YisV [Sporolactobacillus putidus]